MTIDFYKFQKIKVKVQRKIILLNFPLFVVVNECKENKKLTTDLRVYWEEKSFFIQVKKELLTRLYFDFTSDRYFIFFRYVRAVGPWKENIFSFVRFHFSSSLS